MDEPHSLFQKIKARWTKIKMSLICSSRSAGARGPVWKINKLSLVNPWFIEIESYVRFEKPPIKKHCWPTIIPPFWISLPNHIINTMTIVIFLDTRFALPYNTRDANKKLAVALLCFALRCVCARRAWDIVYTHGGPSITTGIYQSSKTRNTNSSSLSPAFLLSLQYTPYTSSTHNILIIAAPCCLFFWLLYCHHYHIYIL